MVVNRPTPTCPKCGEVIANAINKIQFSDVPFYGDNFSHWEYFYHVCDCKHDWVTNREESVQEGRILKICRNCGKEDIDFIIKPVSEYEKIKQKFAAMKSRLPILDKSDFPPLSDDEITRRLNAFAEWSKGEGLTEQEAKDFEDFLSSKSVKTGKTFDDYLKGEAQCLTSTNTN